MTEVPPLTGPASRVTLPPLLRTRSQACARFGRAAAEMRDRAAEVVAAHAVVVGELEDRGAALRVVADEGERILLLGPVGRAQELHAENFGVELDGALQVADAQHRVQDSHVAPWMIGSEAPASSSWCRARRQSGESLARTPQKPLGWFISTRWATPCATTYS